MKKCTALAVLFCVGISLALGSFLVLTGTPAAAQQPQKPNVVFILADNVGYGDLGPYGGGELRARRRHGSTNWPAKDCG